MLDQEIQKQVEQLSRELHELNQQVTHAEPITVTKALGTLLMEYEAIHTTRPNMGVDPLQQGEFFIR